MRKVIIAVCILIILVGGVLLVDHSMRVNRRIAPDSSAEGGTPEAAKVLPADAGFTDFATKKRKTFKDFAGKVVLVNFWASWCEACMDEMPSIQKLYEQLKDQGFEVIAINVDDNPDKVVPAIVSKLKLTFPVFTDPDNSLQQFFNVVAIPLSAVADKQQKIVWSESGEKDWSSPKVVEDIKKLLKPI